MASVPVSGMRGPAIQLELPGHEMRQVLGGTVAPGFLSAFGVRILAGRDLVRSDVAAVLVNASLAALIEKDGHAVGRQVRIDGRVAQVVGVFNDTAFTSVRETIPPRCSRWRHPAEGAIWRSQSKWQAIRRTMSRAFEAS